MTVLTKKQQKAVDGVLRRVTLVHGVGRGESVCTVAAINIALTGEVTDRLPACMSPVVHGFIIPLQDAIPVPNNRSRRRR